MKSVCLVSVICGLLTITLIVCPGFAFAQSLDKNLALWKACAAGSVSDVERLNQVDWTCDISAVNDLGTRSRNGE